MSRRTGGCCLFDTAMGACGVGWSERGVTRLVLPDADPEATAGRLGVRREELSAVRPPGHVARVIADVRRYLDGARVEFAGAPLDLSGVTPFRRSVYEAARRLGWGETISYGALALRAGHAGAARAVGQALANNPVAIIIPCHRILASGRKLGGFTAFGGTCAKELLLALEGVRLGRE